MIEKLRESGNLVNAQIIKMRLCQHMLLTFEDNQMKAICDLIPIIQSDSYEFLSGVAKDKGVSTEISPKQLSVFLRNLLAQKSLYESYVESLNV